MTQDQQAPLPNVGDLAKEVAHVRTVGVGRPPRKNVSIDGLEAIARELAQDPSRPSLGLVEEAIRSVIERSGKGKFARAMALEFGADKDTDDAKTLTDRQELAATELNISLDTLKKNYDDRMCKVIAEDLLKQVLDRRSKVPTTTTPPNTTTLANVSTESGKPSRRRSRTQWLALIAVVVAMSGIADWLLNDGVATGPPTPPTPTLSVLEAEANRALALNETPVPGTASRTLGFGDSVGGRPTYPYIPGAVATTKPTIDSMVDMPTDDEINDEREFLHVTSVELKVYPTNEKAYGKLPLTTPLVQRRGVILHTGTAALIRVYIENNAPPRCGPKESYVARNARLRLAVWSPPNGRLHVVRAWIDAENTTPRWITDAVPIITTAATELVFDPSRSEVEGIKDSGFLVKVFSTKSLQTSGMLLEGTGEFGGCFNGRDEYLLLFRQR
jgi:hypothetical protein